MLDPVSDLYLALKSHGWFLGFVAFALWWGVTETRRDMNED